MKKIESIPDIKKLIGKCINPETCRCGETHLTIWIDTFPDNGFILRDTKRETLEEFLKIIQKEYMQHEVDIILSRECDVDIYRNADLFVFGYSQSSLNKKITLKQFIDLELSYSWC